MYFPTEKIILSPPPPSNLSVVPVQKYLYIHRYLHISPNREPERNLHSACIAPTSQDSTLAICFLLNEEKFSSMLGWFPLASGSADSNSETV